MVVRRVIIRNIEIVSLDHGSKVATQEFVEWYLAVVAERAGDQRARRGRIRDRDSVIARVGDVTNPVREQVLWEEGSEWDCFFLITEKGRESCGWSCLLACLGRQTASARVVLLDGTCDALVLGLVCTEIQGTLLEKGVERLHCTVLLEAVVEGLPGAEL